MTYDAWKTTPPADWDWRPEDDRDPEAEDEPREEKSDGQADVCE